MRKSLALLLLTLMMIGLVAATFARGPDCPGAETIGAASVVGAASDAFDQDENIADDLSAATVMEGGSNHVSN